MTLLHEGIRQLDFPYGQQVFAIRRECSVEHVDVRHPREAQFFDQVRSLDGDHVEQMPGWHRSAPSAVVTVRHGAANDVMSRSVSAFSGMGPPPLSFHLLRQQSPSLARFSPSSGLVQCLVIQQAYATPKTPNRKRQITNERQTTIRKTPNAFFCT